MKLSQLEAKLDRLSGFEKPKVRYEQYATDAHLAARALYIAQNDYQDIEGKIVGDLGCGAGIFTVGSILLGSSHNVAMDIDPDAFHIFRKNCVDFGLLPDPTSDDEDGENEYASIECIQCDVLNYKDLFRHSFLPLCDIVFTNPPFGTKNNAGIDMLFLQVAIELSRVAVYSLHKTSTRPFILKKALEWQVLPTVLAEMKFHIPNMYHFHKKDLVEINVDLYRFEKIK